MRIHLHPTNVIYYSLSGENVFSAWAAMRELGMSNNAEVEKVVQDFKIGFGNMDYVSPEALLKMIENDEVILLDFRPEEEYNRGHIHRALSIQIEKLNQFIEGLSTKKSIFAYCRGPFCVYADEAVSFLNNKGYHASRMKEGFADWALKGYPVD